MGTPGPSLLVCLLSVCLVACADTSPPSWPAGAKLSASEKGKTWVKLSWPAAQDNRAVTGYRIIKGVKETVKLGPAARSHKVKGLDDLSTYGLYVQASDRVGNWSTSLSTTITTLDGSAPTWPDESGFKVEVILVKGAHRAKFTWAAAVDNGPIKAYRLAKDGSLMAEIAADATEYLYQGSDYKGAYTLEAVDGMGNKSEALNLQVTSGSTPPADDPAKAEPDGDKADAP